MLRLESSFLTSLMLMSLGLPMANAQSNNTAPAVLSLRDAANSWQATPKSEGTQVDTTDGSSREKRNQRWQSQLAIYEHLKPGESVVITGGSTKGQPPELPQRRDATWAIVLFEDFHVYAASEDSKAVYTEMNFRIEQIFRNNAAVPSKVGDLIDVGIAGGRLTRKNGVLNTTPVTPEKKYFIPGHRYLVAFSPVGDGSFQILKRWDVSDGTVRIDDEREARRAARFGSKLDGIPLSAVSATLNRELPDQSRSPENK